MSRFLTGWYIPAVCLRDVIITIRFLHKYFSKAMCCRLLYKLYIVFYEYHFFFCVGHQNK